MKKLVIITVLLQSASLFAQKEEGFSWETRLATAEIQARERELPLLVYFRCPP